MSDPRTSDLTLCPLCRGRDAHLFHSDADREYLRCDFCALVFVRPEHRLQPLPEVLRYLEHRNSADDEGYVSFLRRLADPASERLPAGARGLDFGCGPAPVLGALLTGRGTPCASYDPLFLPDETLLDTTYDFVTCSEVMEHVHDPRSLLHRLARLLRPGGMLAVMTRFHGVEAPFASWWYRRDPTHVCFYHETTMRWIAGEFGWRLELPAPNVALFMTAAAQPESVAKHTSKVHTSDAPPNGRRLRAGARA